MRSIVFLFILVAACTTTERQERRTDRPGGNSPKVDDADLEEVKLILPSAPEGETRLTNYRFATEWRNADCAIPHGDHEAAFTGREVLRIRVKESCAYRVHVELGEIIGAKWVVYYDAKVEVDSATNTSTGTQVFVTRTPDGERLGFPVELKPLIDPGTIDPGTTDGDTDRDVSEPTDTTGDPDEADLTDPERNDPDGDGIVEFRIAQGTGNGAWNTAATIVRVKVGQTLRIYNDDAVIHQMHTDGRPCPHGNVIRPGAYGDCVATLNFRNGPLYDHNTRGSFYIEAVD